MSRRTFDVGVDIDDVIYPWSITAHRICERAGITNGKMFKSWHMWEDYGCTKEEWLAALEGPILTGELHQQQPLHYEVLQLHRLRERGHRIHLVTARGHHDHAEVIIDDTLDWLAAWDIPNDSITFSDTKTEVEVDYFVDDSPANYDRLKTAGRNVWLMDAQHNRWDRSCTRRRVPNLFAFANLVIDGEVA